MQTSWFVDWIVSDQTSPTLERFLIWPEQSRAVAVSRAYSVSVTRKVFMLWKKLSTGPERSSLLPVYDKIEDVSYIFIWNSLNFFSQSLTLHIFVSPVSPELTSILVWIFSLDCTCLSKLCVDILKSCRADNREKILYLTERTNQMQVWVTNLCFPKFHVGFLWLLLLSLLVVYSPGLGPVGLLENCWAESRNMTSSEETDKREPWSEKSRRSKPVRNVVIYVYLWMKCRITECDEIGIRIYLSQSYLALSWQTAAVFAGGVIQHQTGPPLRLHMATQATAQINTRNQDDNMKPCLFFLLKEQVAFLHSDLPCNGCCPVLCTVDGPPPSCPRCISVLGLNWQTKPGEDEVNKTQG